MSHGSEKRARDKHLTLRLTAGERAKIDADAERAGLTSGSYARDLLLGAPAPRQVRRPPVERLELARLLGALGRIGGNINQLARAVNTGDEADRTALYGAWADLRAMRDAVLRALGRPP
jgi:hypothetical protein